MKQHTLGIQCMNSAALMKWQHRGVTRESLLSKSSVIVSIFRTSRWFWCTLVAHALIFGVTDWSPLPAARWVFMHSSVAYVDHFWCTNAFCLVHHKSMSTFPVHSSRCGVMLFGLQSLFTLQFAAWFFSPFLHVFLVDSLISCVEVIPDQVNRFFLCIFPSIWSIIAVYFSSINNKLFHSLARSSFCSSGHTLVAPMCCVMSFVAFKKKV